MKDTNNYLISSYTYERKLNTLINLIKSPKIHAFIKVPPK